MLIIDDPLNIVECAKRGYAANRELAELLGFAPKKLIAHDGSIFWVLNAPANLPVDIWMRIHGTCDREEDCWKSPLPKFTQSAEVTFWAWETVLSNNSFIWDEASIQWIHGRYSAHLRGHVCGNSWQVIDIRDGGDTMLAAMITTLIQVLRVAQQSGEASHA